jgi:hypothetical protein
MLDLIASIRILKPGNARSPFGLPKGRLRRLLANKMRFPILKLITNQYI